MLIYYYGDKLLMLSNSNHLVPSIYSDLQADFRRLPESTRAVVGDPARFHCVLPRGQPEPEVTWKKNGVPIQGQWDDELGSLDKERYK